MSETDVGLSELPDGWAWTTLGRIVERNQSEKDKQSIDENLEVHLSANEQTLKRYRITCLKRNGYSSEVKRQKLHAISRWRFLFAKVTCMENGKNIAQDSDQNGRVLALPDLYSRIRFARKTVLTPLSDAVRDFIQQKLQTATTVRV